MDVKLGCLECENYARWRVWYKENLGPFQYRTLCDEHAIIELQQGRNGWPVACIRLIDDCFLPENDRAMIKREHAPNTGREKVSPD